MSVQMVRFRIAREQIPEVTAQISATIDALRVAAPQGVTYTAFRDTEEPSFTLILELAEGTENPLPTLPEAAVFRRVLAGHTDDDAVPRAITVIGRYIPR
ncbi:hypothetical protein [Williamsia sp. 1135]|uniref:hypothetical protein n=1 Tax=Williamsia sp. 1135 TaxID=1889262 RepID=UPI000A12110C|nr:hypothetical protein [Williamsia sp. 1135]ORM38305.1 hypothetical protein BFL43_00160 [Williamsia sp. 1135]